MTIWAENVILNALCIFGKKMTEGEEKWQQKVAAGTIEPEEIQGPVKRDVPEKTREGRRIAEYGMRWR